MSMPASEVFSHVVVGMALRQDVCTAGREIDDPIQSVQSEILGSAACTGRSGVQTIMRPTIQRENRSSRHSSGGDFVSRRRCVAEEIELPLFQLVTDPPVLDSGMSWTRRQRSGSVRCFSQSIPR